MTFLGIWEISGKLTQEHEEQVTNKREKTREKLKERWREMKGIEKITQTQSDGKGKGQTRVPSQRQRSVNCGSVEQKS